MKKVLLLLAMGAFLGACTSSKSEAEEETEKAGEAMEVEEINDIEGAIKDEMDSVDATVDSLATEKATEEESQ